MSITGKKDTRERMIESAVDLFRSRGYSGTGFRDVIAHSGAPRGSIYHHFPRGKAQLAEEVIRHDAEAFGAHIESLQPTNSIALVHAYMEWARRRLKASSCRAGCPVAALVVEAHDGSDVLDAASDSWAGAVDVLAAALQADGVPRRRATNLATVTFASLHGAVLLCRAARDTAALDTAERELKRVLRDAIAEARG
jgi:AcrR family transcriptional regulator